jgi:BlaR1 peptidase M56/Carboxypeptidase regulatory-like domain
MRPWSEMMSDWLVDYYALTTAVLVVASVVMSRLRQPARRLSVARSAVAGLAMLAVLAALPGWPRATWRSRAGRTQPDRPSVAGTLGQDSATRARAQHAAWPGPPDAMSTGTFLPAGREESIRAGSGLTQPLVGTSGRIPTVEWRSDWPDLVGRVFVAGAALALAWLGIGLWQTTVLRCRSRPAPKWSRDVLASIVGDGRAAPDLLVSGWLAQPVAVGMLSPAIILPERFVADEPRCRLEAALAHEWVHFRNRDLWWIALSGLLMPVLFAHPVYWWLRRRAREDQELLADAAAADGRVDYAEALLAWARQTPDRPRLAAAGSLALWERPSQLKRRILMLLDRDFRVEQTCPRLWNLSVRSAMALSVLALSVLTLRPSAVAGGADPAARQVAHAAQQSGPKKDEAVESGATVQVLDPDGKPAAGAAVFRASATFRAAAEPGTVVLLTRTGPDGSFRLSPADARAVLDLTPPPGFAPQIVVTAEGCGPAIIDSSAGDGIKRIRLVKDDVPIRGRLIDLQGRPVVGATIQLVGIFWHPSGNLDEWLKAMKTKKVNDPVYSRLIRYWASDEMPSMFPAVTTTDRDGRFTVKGVGRERIASLLVSGPGIVTRMEFAATRDMPMLEAGDTYHGAACDLVAGPGLEIVGTVRDKDTGKPLAGVTVQSQAHFGNPSHFLNTKTDADGRYRLLGLPPRTIFGDGQVVLAAVKDGPAYLPSVQNVGDERGLDPIRRDFALKRGAWTRGRVTDQSTGKPVRAYLSYHILADNPHLKDYPPYGTIRFQMPFYSDENGEFKIAVMPGRAILGARTREGYRIAVGIDKLDVKKMGPHGIIHGTRPEFIAPAYNTLVEINPKATEDTVKVDIELDPGRTLKGTLIGPDGEPVVGALWLGTAERFEMWSTPNTLPSADFEMHVASKGKCGLLFYHKERQLAGAYVGEPDASGPVTVKLERCGTLTGRLIGDDGLPRAGVVMTADRPYNEGDSRFEKGSLPGGTRTDLDGRFSAPGLVPGMKYSLNVWRDEMIVGEPVKDVITKAGETRDLGDVKWVD